MRISKLKSIKRSNCKTGQTVCDSGVEVKLREWVNEEYKMRKRVFYIEKRDDCVCVMPRGFQTMTEKILD